MKFALGLLLSVSLHWTACSAQAAGLLFIIGGESDGVALADVEVVDLSSETVCAYKPADFPIPAVSTNAIYIEELPHVCGGATTDGGEEINIECYGYTNFGDSWDVHASLLTARSRSASVWMNDEQFWVTGGNVGGDVRLAQTEIYTDGDPNAIFVDMPVERERHAILKITDDLYFLTGGRGEQEDGRRTWSFSFLTSNWTELTPATEDRDSAFAAVVTRTDGTKEVMVAGGFGHATSEIYSFETKSWSAGPDLPAELYDGYTVALGNSFLLVGGATTGDVAVNNIWWYDEVGNGFVQLPQTMVTARRYHSAVLLPEGYLSCE